MKIDKFFTANLMVRQHLVSAFTNQKRLVFTSKKIIEKK